MVTDRELLELAAKAAGHTHALCYDASPEDGFPMPYCKIGKRQYFNPLTDDGDALRLACALELQIDIVGAGMCEITSQRFSERIWEHDTPEYDTARALRRAIVRAAAEIGRAMP